MTLAELDANTVKLLTDKLWMRERQDMTLFFISDWALGLKNGSSPKEGVRMMIVLKRKIVNELMTTYLPSVLLLLITWATTFFKPYFFEAALSVNLTTMLVLTTIFIGVMQTLPTTAYVKMIDVWLIGCQLIPFLEVVLLTLSEFFRKGDGSGEEQSEEEDVSTISGEKSVTTEPTPGVAKIPGEAWGKKKKETTWIRFTGKSFFSFFFLPILNFRAENPANDYLGYDYDLRHRCSTVLQC